MEQIKIYCPVCREELKANDDPFNLGNHPLEDYRIDCEHCGLNAWVEDVSVRDRKKERRK